MFAGALIGMSIIGLVLSFYGIFTVCVILSITLFIFMMVVCLYQEPTNFPDLPERSTFGMIYQYAEPFLVSRNFLWVFVTRFCIQFGIQTLEVRISLEYLPNIYLFLS